MLPAAAVRESAWAAAIVYAARLAGVWAGCWLGAEASGTSPEVGRCLWMGMVTQAGIALGLAKAVAQRFPDWGPDFAGEMGGRRQYMGRRRQYMGGSRVGGGGGRTGRSICLPASCPPLLERDGAMDAS